MMVPLSFRMQPVEVKDSDKVQGITEISQGDRSIFVPTVCLPDVIAVLQDAVGHSQVEKKVNA